MINILNKENCSGCTACYAICPREAIVMEEDEEGFLYPKVVSSLCVNCGACEKACPIGKSDSTEEYLKNSELYAVQSLNNELRSKSTAGGFFSLIADYIIGNSGVVYGAGWYLDRVKHICISDKEDILYLCGSKYVQSYLDDTLIDIKNRVKSGELVLFVGTPCQVHAVKSVVGCPDNLITVDLLCLGVSSQKVMGKWINYLENRYSRVVYNVEFRNKEYGYSVTNVRVNFESGDYLEQVHDSKSFSQLFFNGYNVRPSCYECLYREKGRVSDFTIGDCVDIGHYSKGMDDDKGTTRVWVHTSKGKEIFSKMNGYKAFHLDTDYPVIGGFAKQISIPDNRESFFKDADNLSWSEFCSKYAPFTIKGFVASKLRVLLNNTVIGKIVFKKLRMVKSKIHKNNIKKLNKG